METFGNVFGGLLPIKDAGERGHASPPCPHPHMFSRVHEMGVLTSSTPIAPLVVCYLCSNVDETGGKVMAWVMEDVLRIVSPRLHESAVQHGFSALDVVERRLVPPMPSPRCHWVELQKRAVVILAMLDSPPFCGDNPG